MKLIRLAAMFLACLAPLGLSYAQSSGSSSSPSACPDACKTVDVVVDPGKPKAKPPIPPKTSKSCEDCECEQAKGGNCRLMNLPPDNNLKCSCRLGTEPCAPYKVIKGKGYATKCDGVCPNSNEKCELAASGSNCGCVGPQVSPPPDKSIRISPFSIFKSATGL